MDTHQIFIQVVEQGSFNRAAEKLGITQPTVSKRMDTLEDKLGVKLLKRSTRQLILTSAGKLYYERAKEIHQLINQTDNEIRSLSESEDKLLKISASMSVSSIFLPAVIKQLREQHPHTSIHIHTDLEAGQYYRQHYELEYDLFIHEGESVSDNMVARSLADIPMGIYAAPTFLESMAPDNDLGSLAKQGYLITTRVLKAQQWPNEMFANVNGGHVKYGLTGNEGTGLVKHAEQGLGCILMPHHLVMESIAEGRLVPVERDFELPTIPLSVLYRKEYLSPVARDCVDLLRSHIAERCREF